MYTQQSIEKALDSADIVQIIGRDTTLKQSGAQWKGCSPFTAEKSPSFFVNPSKQVWYCYSSQEGGGVVKYLELKHGMTFIDAVKMLADVGNVLLEEQEETETDRRHRSDRVEMERVMRATFRKWHEQLAQDWDKDGPISKYLQGRGYTREECAEWGIGYAPDQRDFITRAAIDSGMWKYAEQAGIITTKDERNFDTLQNRITFEITDTAGRAVGFSGRQAPGNDFGGKYINTKQTPLFDKGRTIYGMEKARKHIVQQKCAILMEGFTDVHAAHRVGIANAVACMGTALTDSHAKQLARLCPAVLIVSDGDAAGRKMAVRSLPILLSHGLEVRVAVMPDGKDPDEWCREDAAAFTACIEQYEDGLMAWVAAEITAASSPAERGQAIEAIAAMLGNVQSDSVASAYLDEIATRHKKQGVKRTELAKVLSKHNDMKGIEKAIDGAISKLPEGVDHDFVGTYGFYPLVDKFKTGYYFLSDGGGTTGRNVSNFVLEPIFHRRAPNDSADDARVIRINNGIHPPRLVMMPSDALVSVEMFKKWCFRQGSYQWKGGPNELMRLVASILFQLPEAHEITTLGYQPEGFFAYQNAIYNGKLVKYDAYGLVKHGDMHFFSPGVSDIFKGVRDEDNKYKYDKFLTYIPSEITFDMWAGHMKDVYGSFGMPAVAFAMLSAFRDVVFQIDKNCPFLYIYGPSQSGKSKIAESIQAIFFYKRQMFQINSGTEFAFMTYMGRFRNTPSGFNEFDDKYMRGPKDGWFQIIKGSYDGEGRMRGSGDKRNIEIQEVMSTIMLVGQYLSTRDDNSVLSRSVVLAYVKRAFSQDEVEKYSRLKEWEDKGITNVSAELLSHRKVVEKSYRDTIYQEIRTLKKIIADRGEFANDRVVRNYAAFLSMWNIFSSIFTLPWTLAEFRQWAADEVVHMSITIATNDVLHEFWSQMESMTSQRLLRNGIHFKMKENEVSFKHSDGHDVVVDDGPANLLYIRPKLIHPEYLRSMRSQGLDGLNQTTLLSYMEQRPYFLGKVKAERFDVDNGEGSVQTSAYVLNWDELKATTEITLGMVPGKADESIVASAVPVDDLPF